MASRRSKFFCRWAGFTLVELILVLMVLTVMVSIVAPSLRGFGVGRQSSDAATQILSLAQWARAQAVTDGKVYRLNFDVTGRTFGVTVQEAGVFEAAPNEYGD